MHNFKSHFWWDFSAYCTRPVSVNLVMAFNGCSFDSFSIFLLSLKQQQKLMKIMFSCIHFPVWPYPPKIMKKLYFILGKLYGLTGMWLHHDSQNWKLMLYAVHMFHTHQKQALWMSLHASISMLLCAAKTSQHGSHWGRLATDFAKCSTCSGLFSNTMVQNHIYCVVQFADVNSFE